MKDPAGEVHTSVLGSEVVEYMQPVSGSIYVDGTLGLGGHAEQILDASGSAGRLIGFEWDDQALTLARQRLAGFGERVHTIRASYADLATVLEREGMMQVHGLLLDLGVSSLQLDVGERGFSFQVDAPLDMRMDKRRPETAAHLVARLSREELADIFIIMVKSGRHGV